MYRCAISIEGQLKQTMSHRVDSQQGSTSFVKKTQASGKLPSPSSPAQSSKSNQFNEGQKGILGPTIKFQLFQV